MLLGHYLKQAIFTAEFFHCQLAKSSDSFHLIDGARNETSDVLLALEDEGEGGGEGRDGLDGGKHDLPDVCAVVEAEDAANLNETTS